MSNKRLTGTDGKTRRGAGWGGKGSAFVPQPGMTRGRPRIFADRHYEGYRSKPGRSGKPWQAKRSERLPRIAA